MTSTRTRVPVLAVVVYAALGMAIGMVLWALLIHSGSGGDSGGDKSGSRGGELRLDQLNSDERSRPRDGGGE
jgi:hypothetical protein